MSDIIGATASRRDTLRDAAPALYEAAKKADSCLRDSVEFRTGNPAFEQAVAAIFHAVAKAEGRTP